MKRFAQSLLLAVFTMFSMGLTCNAQNGPSPMQAVATWTQALPTATSGPVTANSVYRCATAGCTPAPPAIYTSTAPITTYTDTTIAAGTTYIYSVTAHFGTVEGPYSNDSAPYSWAYTAPTIPVITGSLVPQAQAQDVVAKGWHVALGPVLHRRPCRGCSTVSSLVVRTK